MSALMTIFANRSFNLTAELSPSDCTDNVKWTSSDDTVASVEDGVVTGVAAGNATITASITVDGVTYSDTCAVTVSEG